MNAVPSVTLECALHFCEVPSLLAKARRIARLASTETFNAAVEVKDSEFRKGITSQRPRFPYVSISTFKFGGFQLYWIVPECLFWSGAARPDGPLCLSQKRQ
jgi:hypothetical protein